MKEKMTRDEFCSLVKEKYPEISKKADKEYLRRWDDYVDDEYYSYSWFEALANALNSEMNKDIPADNYKELFELISTVFDTGCEEIKKAIDVAFVENLFWAVYENKSECYWALLPENLKKIYVNFHGKTPL